MDIITNARELREEIKELKVAVDTLTMHTNESIRTIEVNLRNKLDALKNYLDIQFEGKEERQQEEQKQTKKRKCKSAKRRANFDISANKENNITFTDNFVRNYGVEQYRQVYCFTDNIIFVNPQIVKNKAFHSSALRIMHIKSDIKTMVTNSAKISMAVWKYGNGKARLKYIEDTEEGKIFRITNL